MILSAAIAAQVRTENLFEMGFEAGEELQRCFVRVAAGMGRGGQVEIDPAGQGPDAIDAAVLATAVEEGAKAAVVKPLRQQIEEFLLGGEDIGPALAAGAGAATDGESGLAVAEGEGVNPPAEAVGTAIKEGDLPPALVTGALAPDDAPLQLLDFARNDGRRVATIARAGI